MASFIAAVVCLLIALLAVVLRKVYFGVPIAELKRRARTDDHQAQLIYRAVAYGNSLRVFLWLLLGFGSAASFVLFARLAPAWLGFVAIAIALWLAFSWLPNTRRSGLANTLARVSTPAVAWLLNYLHPVFDRLSSPFGKRYAPGQHTGLFETDDFLDLFDRQATQADNRLQAEELGRVRRALQFSGLTVHDHFVSRKKVRTVAPDEAITPVLASELHATGHVEFPVYDKLNKQVVGILPMGALNDISHVKKGGTVADVMETRIAHVHEQDSLSEVLGVFYKTKQTLFVVVNNTEGYVGIITTHDLLKAIAGEAANSGFTAHEDRTAVAHKHHAKPEPEPELEVVSSEPELDPDAPDLEVVSIDDEPVAPQTNASQTSNQETLSETDETVVE